MGENHLKPKIGIVWLMMLIISVATIQPPCACGDENVISSVCCEEEVSATATHVELAQAPEDKNPGQKMLCLHFCCGAFLPASAPFSARLLATFDGSFSSKEHYQKFSNAPPERPPSA